MATHPGAILGRELQERGLKQKDFARMIGVEPSNLNALIKGKRNLTEELAIKLERALAIPFNTWMNLQANYNGDVAKIKLRDEQEEKAVNEEKSFMDLINLKAVYKTLEISALSACDRMAKLKVLNINLRTIQSIESSTVGCFKRSSKLKIDEKNMRTWLLLAWIKAHHETCDARYKKGNGDKAAYLIAEKANKGEITIKTIKEILNGLGIMYLHVEKLEQAPVDAYSTLAGNHPVIVVTYRHNDLDKLVFDILHELGHIEKHLTNAKSFIRIEDDYSEESREEVEANAYARDALIPPAVWKKIITGNCKDLEPFSIIKTISTEAKRNGISQTIAISRYKHDTKHYAIRGFRSPKIV